MGGGGAQKELRSRGPTTPGPGRPCELGLFLIAKYESMYLFYTNTYIVALECKPANSQQGYFTGQTKNKQNLLLFRKETIFHIFFLQLTIVILSSSFN